MRRIIQFKSISPRLWLLITAGVCLAAPSHAQGSYAFSEKNDRWAHAGTYTPVDNPDQKESKASLFDVLKDLNKKKGVFFLFSDPAMADKKVNTVADDKQSVTRILDQVLDNTGLKYKKISDNTFVIVEDKGKKKDRDILVNFNGSFSGIGDSPSGMVNYELISGRVTDANGMPLAGVTVSVKGTHKGTSTNADGQFALQAGKGDVLVFSFVGYEPKEVTVGDDNSINITLSITTRQMDEVVVTALGVKKQAKALGYSTTEVAGDKLTKSRILNVGNALSGQVAGVNVAGAATGPYGSSRVVIRGNSSLTGNNQPLYVIDGVPYDNSNQGNSGQWGGADFGDGLSNINPDDIESIQVLKGVAASALYGYRGGNGAILITTKSGAHGHGLGVELNNNLTFNSVVDEREYQYEYGQGTQGVKPTTQAAAMAVPTSSWGAKMDGSDAVNFLGDTYAYSPAKDNFKNFYKTGLNNQASIALTGSNDKGHFRLGLSDLYMNTVIPSSGMKQQGVNFNSTYNVTDKLHVSLNANYLFEKVDNRASFSDAPGSVIASTLYLASSYDIRWLKPTVKADGSELLPGDDIYFNNPYFVAYRFQNSTNRNRLTGGLTLKYDLTSWLSVQGQVTRDGYIFDVNNVVPTGTGYSPGGQLTQYTVNYHELNANYMLDFNKKLKDISIHAFVGGNSQDNVWSQAGIFGAGPFKVPYFYSASNISDKPYSYSYSHYRVNSIYGSADIGYKDYLFLTLTARNDWFSTLNINTDHYLYPSVSGSFVFSDAFHLPAWISFGKLRASYAQSSNGTSPYRNLLTYGLQGYTISGQSLGYVNQSDIPNANLKPVNIQEEEVGLNLQFLNDRLGLDVAVYNKKTTDDILNVTVSQASGYSGNIANIGQLRNRGVELLLTATPVRTHDFSWNTSFNFAVNNNKVLALSPGVESIVIDGAYPRWGDGVSVKHVVGQPYGQIVGYAYKRDAGGKIIFDANGLPERSDAVVPLGSGTYKTTGGFNNDFHYKDLTLSCLIDFKYGAKIYSGTNVLLYTYGLQKTTLQGRDGGYVGQGVTEDGHANTTSVPAEIYFNDISTGANHVTEEFVYDASFIKLRSIALSYAFPATILKKGFIKGLTLSLVGRNLATLMKHTPNIDPESNLNNTNGQGLELSGYPMVRSLGFNLNVKF